MSAGLAICSIGAKSTLSQARVLARSFRRHHPENPFFLLLADEIDGYFDPLSEPFQLLTLTDLQIPNIQAFRFAHADNELRYAATPFLLRHLLDRGYASVGFMKEESLVLASLLPILSIVAEHSITLTPHILSPLQGLEAAEREVVALCSGIFNVGFLGVSATPAARHFLDWWTGRVYGDCSHDIGRGQHYEQRWLDLVPAQFDDVHILRDPGFNVGHWNLPERWVTSDGAQFWVGGHLCRYVRMSGYEFDLPERATRYFGRLSMSALGDAAQIFRRYYQALAMEGYQVTRHWPYACVAFSNGVTVPQIARQIFRGLGPGQSRFDDPFRAGENSFFAWINGHDEKAEATAQNPAPGWEPCLPKQRATVESPSITRLWKAVYRGRPDLQRAFPDPDGVDRDRFLSWTVHHGLQEHQISADFLVR